MQVPTCIFSLQNKQYMVIYTQKRGENMDKNIKNKIIDNIYGKANRMFSSNIVLDESLLEDFINNEKPIYGKSIRNLEIVKKRLGVYDNGKLMPMRLIGQENNNVSHQRIEQLVRDAIISLYEIDAKIKAEKIKRNNLQDYVKEADIEFLELDKKTTEEIRKKGYNKIKDLLELTPTEIKEEFSHLGKQQLTLIERINLFGLSLKKETNIENIKEDEISKETFNYLIRRGIETYDQLLDFIPKMDPEKIPESIRIEILELQNKYNQRSKSLDIIKNIKYIEKRIEQLEERKDEIQEELEITLHLDLEMSEKSRLIKSIYEKQNIVENMIQNLKRTIDNLSRVIQGKFEINISPTLRKKISD